MALTFALPPGASEPREPYVPAQAGETDNPEQDLRNALASIAGQLDTLSERMLRAIGDDWRASEEMLDRAERAATALNTATAIYRARRNP